MFNTNPYSCLAGESLPAVMLAPGTALADRKGRDHTSGHHHHPMVGRVYSFDASLVNAKVSGPLPPVVPVTKAAVSFFTGVSSPPPSVTAPVASSSVQVNSQQPAKKTRLDSNQTSHSSPTTSPPSSSNTSPGSQSVAPLRCTICNG